MKHVAGCLALAAAATTVVHLAYWGMRPGTLIVIASTTAVLACTVGLLARVAGRLATVEAELAGLAKLRYTDGYLDALQHRPPACPVGSLD